MSGLDEQNILSCDCAVRNSSESNQYWFVRDRSGDRIGYFNPDKFRESDAREDVLNTTSNYARAVILRDTDRFINSIEVLCCNLCGDRIMESNLVFNKIVQEIKRFVIGDKFEKMHYLR